MNVRNLKQKTHCQNLYGFFGKSEFFCLFCFFSKNWHFFENQLNVTFTRKCEFHSYNICCNAFKSDFHGKIKLKLN